MNKKLRRKQRNRNCFFSSLTLWLPNDGAQGDEFWLDHIAETLHNLNPNKDFVMSGREGSAQVNISHRGVLNTPKEWDQ